MGMKTRSQRITIAHTIAALLRAMLMDHNMLVEMVEGSEGLSTILPRALIQPLGLVIALTRTFLQSVAWP
jgi:hypothetical protein